MRLRRVCCETNAFLICGNRVTRPLKSLQRDSLFEISSTVVWEQTDRLLNRIDGLAVHRSSVVCRRQIPERRSITRIQTKQLCVRFDCKVVLLQLQVSLDVVRVQSDRSPKRFDRFLESIQFVE